MKTSSDRLREARLRAGFETAQAAINKFGWKASTYRSHENGQTEVPKGDAREYAKAFNVDASWILFDEGKGPSGELKSVKGTKLKPIKVPAASGRRLSVFGAAMAGREGKFVFNTDLVDTVACPPGLENVPDAYAVYVNGDSMEPRYFAGEAVFVHPRKVVKKGDFVVVQLHAEEENGDEEGFVKRFVTLDQKKLVVEQYNPPKRMEFPRSRVKAIHRIVMGGDA